MFLATNEQPTSNKNAVKDGRVLPAVNWILTTVSVQLGTGPWRIQVDIRLDTLN